LSFSAGGVSYAPTGVPEATIGHVRPARKPINEGGSTMIRRSALLIATLFAAGTAFAFHCPQDMKKIDDAMAKNPKLTAAQADEVKKYRAEGETLHKAGKHQESVDTLAKAMKILDVK
jgi:hypothetical protein